MAVQRPVEQAISITDVAARDVPALLALEQECFTTDRLSKRQFNHWVKAAHRVFLVAKLGDVIVAYGLVIMRKGTRMARLYSIAVGEKARGRGVGKMLMRALEEQTLAFNKLFIRLEVAVGNEAAIKLYQSLGYKTFGTYTKYYDDESDALRMQKDIRQDIVGKRLPPYPWYQQTTEFTCGPSALMMAMASLTPKLKLEQQLELDLWREATTIFMMAGHGGSHPLGLALAAEKRGFQCEVFINQDLPLFTPGVRNEHKKQIVTNVEQHFLNQARAESVTVKFEEFTLEHLQQCLSEGKRVLSLISTYQLDGHKVPHWVAVTALDSACLYLHDPCVDELHSAPLDCQHIPIAREDFYTLSSYGKNKLRTAVVLSPMN